MNRAGLLGAAGGGVAIGLAPVVPLLLTHDHDSFAVPDVHFYAVSATALTCAALALALGVLGARRRDRRTAGIGAGFTVMAALLAVHGLTTPGFLVESEYTAAVGVAGALAVPLGGAVILATLLSRPRQLGYVRDLVLLQAGIVAAVLAFGGLALLQPQTIPEIPVALRPLVWWVVGANALIYGVLSMRALRTFQLTRRLGDLAVSAGLVWLAIAVATYLLSPVWSVGFWSGHVLELGAFLVITTAIVSDLVRATPSRTLHSAMAVSDVVPSRRSCSAPGWRVCSPASPSRTPRRASTRAASRASASSSGRSSGCAARACAAWPSRHCCTTWASCRCRTRSSARPAR